MSRYPRQVTPCWRSLPPDCTNWSGDVRPAGTTPAVRPCRRSPGRTVSVGCPTGLMSGSALSRPLGRDGRAGRGPRRQLVGPAGRRRSGPGRRTGQYGHVQLAGVTAQSRATTRSNRRRARCDRRLRTPGRPDREGPRRRAGGGDRPEPSGSGVADRDRRGPDRPAVRGRRAARRSRSGRARRDRGLPLVGAGREPADRGFDRPGGPGPAAHPGPGRIDGRARGHRSRPRRCAVAIFGWSAAASARSRCRR